MHTLRDRHQGFFCLSDVGSKGKEQSVQVVSKVSGLPDWVVIPRGSTIIGTATNVRLRELPPPIECGMKCYITSDEEVFLRWS
jgi:hypothetical protein